MSPLPPATTPMELVKKKKTFSYHSQYTTQRFTPRRPLREYMQTCFLYYVPCTYIRSMVYLQVLRLLTPDKTAIIYIECLTHSLKLESSIPAGRMTGCTCVKSVVSLWVLRFLTPNKTALMPAITEVLLLVWSLCLPTSATLYNHTTCVTTRE